MRLQFIALILFLPASVAMSQTHCKKGETDYFSCVTDAAEKVMSICGTVPDGAVDDDSWLQYRFGKPGAIELAYPKAKDRSLSKFEGNFFYRFNFSDLRFISGKALYSVNFLGPYDGNDASPRRGYLGGVDVQVHGRAGVNIHCTTVLGRKYFDRFNRLNVSLEQFNGESNFLGRFEGRTPK
jgi:hypothetical protein